MPRYRVNTRSFIADQLVEEGGEIDYEGVPGSNLDPLDKAGEKAKKAAEDLRKKAAGTTVTTTVSRETPQLDAPAEEAVVVRKGDDLTSPFTAANPRPGDGESRILEHGDQHPNPQADRPADPQPEVGPTEAQVDLKAAEKVVKDHAKAAPKAGPKEPDLA